jgi:hypothetical protein
MKKNEKKFLMLVILVGIVIIIITSVVVANNKKKNQNQVAEGQNNTVVEEFVDVLPDGTKLNNSTKLAETKKVGELEISNFQLTEQGSQTLLLGTIKNNTTTKQGGYPATVKIMDKEGNQIVELGAYINEVGPGEEQQFNVSSTLDYANAYDIKIEKK